MAPATARPDTAVTKRMERWLLLDCCLASGVRLVNR